jgi:hypothetical protein
MKGWRTVTFNSLSALTMAASAFLLYVDRLPITDGQAAIAGLIATVIVNGVNMYLRSITTTPMGKSQ